jgi:hypothetical protein
MGADPAGVGDGGAAGAPLAPVWGGWAPVDGEADGDTRNSGGTASAGFFFSGEGDDPEGVGVFDSLIIHPQVCDFRNALFSTGLFQLITTEVL